MVRFGYVVELRARSSQKHIRCVEDNHIKCVKIDRGIPEKKEINITEADRSRIKEISNMATPEKIVEMNKRNIPFSPPDITELEIAEVADALRSGWITTGREQNS